MSPGLLSFDTIDWIVLSTYLVVVIGLGVVMSRTRHGAGDYFLAGRRMPMWAVAISLLATSQSAATFVGGPQQAYLGNLTYLAANLGGLLAAIVVAVFFLPAFYRQQVTSIYELLGRELGIPAQRVASVLFMAGRTLASGARLYIVAIPFSLIAFGCLDSKYLVLSILLIAATATCYTLTGGIRAVIWTDVLQAIIYVGAVSIALVLLWQKMPLGLGELLATLRETGDEQKLSIIDVRLDVSQPYTIWAVIVGLSLFNLAALGTDQDLTQRLLTCRSARRGSWSVIASHLIGWPVLALFLLLGLLLYVYYQRPDIMQAAGPGYVIDDSRRVFLEFIMHEMPVGLRGLMMAGLFAAAMSSMDSALNAMASTVIADFYRPLRRRLSPDQGGETDRRERWVSRWAVAAWAAAMAGVAVGCIFWQQASGQTLIDFALGVMVFAYSGLLAVFLTAIFTRRGNSISAIAAMITGVVAVLLMQEFIWKPWGRELQLAFAWKMTIATGLSFAVCCAGKRR